VSPHRPGIQQKGISKRRARDRALRNLVIPNPESFGGMHSDQFLFTSPAKSANNPLPAPDGRKKHGRLPPVCK
jgi:hypothetical protein